MMVEKGRTVAVIGGGGREAALIHKYSQSPHVNRIVAIPGNDMMQETSEKPVQLFPNVKATDYSQIINICKDEQVDLVDVAQEDAVEQDVVGMMKFVPTQAIGPRASAGRIESDKNFARSFGEYLMLPQPKFTAFNFTYEQYKPTPTIKQVEKYLEEHPNKSWFVKAAGLAQGKGVIPAPTDAAVLSAISELRNSFPDASKVIILEEELIGEEFSAFALSNGKSFKVIGYAQDHKRAFDGDTGPNTGGMGAISNPLLLANTELQKGVEEIFQKTFEGLQQGGIRYKGVLYLGGMAVEEDGKLKPYIIEFNARWGDPEAQVLVPGLEVDLFEMGQRVNAGDFKNFKIKQDGKVRVVVAGVAKGYPGQENHVRGKKITGIDEARKIDGITIYGAGIKIINSKHYVNGGRLFYIVGEGNDAVDARERAYEAMHRITIEDDSLAYRTDIGYRDVARLHKS